MDMVEKVARALAVNDPARLVPDPGKTTGIGEFARPIWHDYVVPARAAIETMREPTPEMAHAGFASDAFRTPMARLEADFEPKAVWSAMIDAALTPS